MEFQRTNNLRSLLTSIVIIHAFLFIATTAPAQANATHPTTMANFVSPTPSFSLGSYDSGGALAKSIGVGDLDGDGWPDLAVANYCSYSFMSCPWTGGSVGVLLNSGGIFYWPNDYPSGGTDTYAVALADVNGDKKIDVLVANFCGASSCESADLLLNSGKGNLQAPVAFAGPVPSPATGTSATADLNGDGYPDLVILGDSSVYVQLGNPDGTYQPATQYDSGGYLTKAVAIVDINGDGYLDILTVNQCSELSGCSTCQTKGSVGVLLGNGDGTFRPPLAFDTGGIGSNPFTIADINRDGKPDILIPNDCSGFQNPGQCPAGDGLVSVLTNTSNYTATSTKLVSSLNPSTAGQSVTFTATVAPNTGTLPDGEFITFKNGAIILATVPLRAGTASFAIKTLPRGTGNITAIYNFDGLYGASVGQVSQVVKSWGGLPTSVSVTATPNPAPMLQSITLSAAVTSLNGTIPDREQVTFYEGTTVLGAAPISAGTANFVTSAYIPSTRHIRAIYPGDATFKFSSGTVNAVMLGFPTAIFSPLEQPNPSIYGQKVTFYVTVTGGNSWGLPTGSVKLTWDRFTIATVPVQPAYSIGATATYTTSILNADTYPLQAIYSGDSLFASSASDIWNHVVLQTTSAATLTSSPNPSVTGQPVTFTAKITSPTVMPKGQVTFTLGKTVLGTVQLTNGKAVLIIPSLLAGTNVVTVTYEGNSNIAGSKASVTQFVQ